MDDIIQSYGLGAATVVVDIDHMAAELKRLQNKPPDAATGTTDVPVCESNSAPGEGGAGADEVKSVPPIVDSRLRGNEELHPVNRPSWNGRLDAGSGSSAGRYNDAAGKYRCGR